MRKINAQPLQQPARIGIVVSRFNQTITSCLLTSALAELRASGVNEKDITVVHVPGAVEIPFAVQRLARCKTVDAVIALGAVIYGETDHYHYVCEQVNQGCRRVMLDESLPVIFGVLTVRTMAQAKARTGGDKGNMGAEAASAALEMVSVTEQIKQVAYSPDEYGKFPANSKYITTLNT